MHRILEAAKSVVPIVLSHNDLVPGNIMLSTPGGDARELRFIDFEYGGRDFLLFDVGNHWNEWAGSDHDFTRYPGPEAQRKFVEIFFDAIAAQCDDASRPDCALIRDASIIDRAVVIANAMSLASNLAWAVWAVIQLTRSNIDFDYLRFCERRVHRFLDTRDMFGTPFIEGVLRHHADAYPYPETVEQTHFLHKHSTITHNKYR